MNFAPATLRTTKFALHSVWINGVCKCTTTVLEHNNWCLWGNLPQSCSFFVLFLFIVFHHFTFSPFHPFTFSPFHLFIFSPFHLFTFSFYSFSPLPRCHFLIFHLFTFFTSRRLRFLPSGVRDANISASLGCVKIKKHGVIPRIVRLITLLHFTFSPFHLFHLFTFFIFSPFHSFTFSSSLSSCRRFAFAPFCFVSAPLALFDTKARTLFQLSSRRPLSSFQFQARAISPFHLFTIFIFIFIIIFLLFSPFHIFTFSTFSCFTIQHFVHLICWIVRSSCPKRLSLCSVGA